MPLHIHTHTGAVDRPRNRTQISFPTSLNQDTQHQDQQHHPHHPQQQHQRTNMSEYSNSRNRAKFNWEHVNSLVIEFTIMCDITSDSSTKTRQHNNLGTYFTVTQWHTFYQYYYWGTWTGHGEGSGIRNRGQHFI